MLAVLKSSSSLRNHSFVRSPVLAVIALALGIAVSGMAQEKKTKGYFRFDMGAAFTEDADIQSFGGDPGDAVAEFDTGFRFDLAGGYRIRPWVSVELEAGFIYNAFTADSEFLSMDNELFQGPIIANVVFQYPSERWIALAGGGVGGSFMTIYDGTYLYYDPCCGYYYGQATESDFVFAYQAFAAVGYKFNELSNLAVFFRWSGARDPSWTLDGFSSSSRVDFDLGSIQTWAFTVAYTMGF